MTAPAERAARPLRGLRVVTLSDDRLPSLGKAFVDLGADVEVLQPSPRAPDHRPLLEMLESRGKRFAAIAAGPVEQSLRDKLRQADVLICTPGVNGVTDVDAVARAHPHLVIAVVTDFGLTGERRDWAGSEAVFHALGGTLSRSGEPGREPLMPPGELFTRGAAQQIAWGVLVQLRQALHGSVRRGAVLDCSIFECGIACFDPAFGMAGSGTPDSVTTRGRPDAGSVYPIFRVRDGFVRVSVLARGQWAALLEWMGRPLELAGEELLTNPGRHARADLVVPAMAAFFQDMTCEGLVAECRGRRIPASRVLSIGDVLTEAHYREVGVLTAVGQVDGRDVIAAEGMARINGVRTVPRPVSGSDEAFRSCADAPLPAGAGPLDGLTVLDLGVIVAGAQASLVFAEQGARVIRVENRQFPDGMRRSFEQLTPALARGHLGKENIGLDLSSDAGRELFTELVRKADIVISNFKPGTVERLGISYADLVDINPGIICMESSAFGDVGPWRSAMGYGPLVRAGSGLTWLWRRDAGSTYFGDGITIYPDHLAGRVCALAALACVLDRERTGTGAHITVAQSDITLVQLAELLAAESIDPGAVQPPGRPARGLVGTVVLAAAGEDEWCVVDPRTTEQLAALRRHLGLAPEDDLDGALADHVRARDARSVADELQAAGVPAAPMLRPHELADDPAVRKRQTLFTTRVAGTDDEVLVERYPILVDGERPRHPDPAPNFGQHTCTVLTELGRDSGEVERLVADGVAQMAESLRLVIGDSGR